MDPKFTDEEIINMILDFFTFTCGYWNDEIEHYPCVKTITEMDGLTKESEDHPDLIVLTEAGKDFFHIFIKSISERFIKYAKTQNLEVKRDNAKNWFNSEFHLSDELTGEEIADYICGNLYHYSYRVSNCYSRRKRDFYLLEKL